MIKRILFLVQLIFLGSILYAQNPVRTEMRAVWLTTNFQLDWPKVTGTSETVIRQQKEELVSILDRLSDAGINTVFFQARVRGAVFYNSTLENFSRYLTGKANMPVNDFDPLAFAVEECHRRNINCHAWINCMPLGGTNYIQKQGLADFVKKNNSFITFHQGEYYLEPSDPRTVKYLACIASEIATHYDVDGIHLDYIRYPEGAYSYPDKKKYAESGKTVPLSQWRRDNITRIVYAIYDSVKSVRSRIQVSSATLGFYNGRHGSRYYGWNAFDAGYQEVEKWLEEDKHDFVVPMMYYKDAMFYPFVVDWFQRSHGKPVIPGLGVYRLDENAAGWTVDEIEKQISWTRKVGGSGYALFRADNLLQNPGLYWKIRFLNE